MHSRGLKIIINIIFWIATAWLITSGFSIQAQEIELVNGEEVIRTVRSESMIIKLLICIGWSLVLFYVNLWNLHRLTHTGGYLHIILISSAILVDGAALFYVSDQYGLLGDALPLPPALSLGIMAFYFTVSSGYGLGKVWFHSHARQQQLVNEKNQAQLDLLRNQLQPHFLFNALNNLLAMVDQKNSPQLAEALDRLSSLLRYVTEETRADKVPLSKEVDFIRHYAALQGLRFESGEVEFNLSVRGPYTDQPIEPGLLIPFVENAFKYGAEPEKMSTISVDIDVTRPVAIDVTISNPVMHDIPKDPHSGADMCPGTGKSTGTGIKSTRDRLNIIYPERHTLQITETDRFIVHLKLRTV